jgi:hypothetical protein
MRYDEKISPKVIGKMFGFRPEKLNHFVNQYVVGAEE